MSKQKFMNVQQRSTVQGQNPSQNNSVDDDVKFIIIIELILGFSDTFFRTS